MSNVLTMRLVSRIANQLGVSENDLERDIVDSMGIEGYSEVNLNASRGGVLQIQVKKSDFVSVTASEFRRIKERVDR